MIYPLSVTAEEIEKIEAAKKRGVDVNALLKAVLAMLSPEPLDENREELSKNPTDNTLTLLEEWLEEAETDDPIEIAQAEKELEEFKSAMNAERARAGARPLYR